MSHTPLTDDELGDIIERMNAASPGPWPTPDEAGDPYDKRIPVDHEGCEKWPWLHDDDMIFAYKARTDVPKLVHEIHRLRSRLALCEDTLDKITWAFINEIDKEQP